MDSITGAVRNVMEGPFRVRSPNSLDASSWGQVFLFAGPGLDVV